MDSFNDILQKILQGLTLNEQQAYAALKLMTANETPDTQRAAFLAMLAARGETAEELTGFLQFIKQNALPITAPHTAPVIDIVGTGGDKLKTFNISTAASIVVASAGINVAKHGGRSVTSLSGSADVLEVLNIPRFEQPDAIINSLTRHHFAFLFAPFFNPLLKQISGLRRELGLRTFFNLLAPLANPAQVQRQVIGLYSEKPAITLVEALKAAGSVHVMAVHSVDGMDEISLSSPTHIVHLKNNHIKKYTVQPEDFGLQRCNLTEVTGGDAHENAAIIKNIFSTREPSPKRDIVILNAAAGFMVADRVTCLSDGILLAARAIDDGSAWSLLNKLIDAHSYA
jgi:anthranilate phosphoribosyltransferase